MGDKLAPWGGWLVFDTRLTPDVITAQGAGTYDSAYTQAGPGPGHPEPQDSASRWRPQVSGAQSVGLRVVTLQGGFAGRRGASVGYLLESDAANTDIRGWDEPTLLTDWTTTSTAWNNGTIGFWSAAVNPVTHEIVITVRGSSLQRTLVYQPRTDTWTNGYNWAGNQGLVDPVAMAFDPERAERLLMWTGDGTAGDLETIAYSSDDNGASFDFYSRGWNDTTFTGVNDRSTVAVAAGLDWLMTNGSRQWASSDRGVTWESIEDMSADGVEFQALRTASGYAIVYLTDVTSRPAIRLLGSPRTPFSIATEIEIDSTTVDEVVACVAPDGIIYAVAGVDGRLLVYRSIDDGATWAKYTWEASDNGNTADIVPRALVSAAGALYVIGTSGGTANGWLNVWRLGGWSNVENGPGGDANYNSRRGRHGYGQYGGSGAAATGRAYTPANMPESQGWTRAFALGTRSLTAVPGLQIATTGANGEQFGHVSGESNLSHVGQAVLAVPTGGTITTNSKVHVSPELSNNVYSYGLAIRIDTDGIRVENGAGTLLGTAAVACTSKIHIRWHLTKGKGSVWYRLPTTTKWTAVVVDGTVTDTATPLGATDGLRWAHRSGGATDTTSVWYMVGWVSGGAFHYDVDSPTDLDDDYADGVRGLFFGKAIPSAASGRVAVPDATASTEGMAFIAAAGGSTRWSEIVSLPVEYQHGIEQACPWLSPKPDRTWESTTTEDDVKVVWDQGANAESWYGGALALVVLNAQPRLFVLEVDDGAGGWTTIGTLDKGWSSINYTRTGRTLVPRAGTATISRYLHEDELAGGYVVMNTAGDPVARRIVHNSAGYLTTDADKQQVRITLDGVDGTETANGSGEIVHHSGIAVFYVTSEAQRRRLRVRIDDDAVVPDGVYRAGVMAIARVVAFPSTSWDWRKILQLSRTTRRGADQVLSARETGPARFVLAQGWADGVAAGKMRTLATDPDYFGVTTGIAVGTDEDAWTSPLQLIATWLESGEVPVVSVSKLPAASGTITDPSLYLYGVLQSDAVSISNVTGTEGVDEQLRVDAPVLESIPWRPLA